MSFPNQVSSESHKKLFQLSHTAKHRSNDQANAASCSNHSDRLANFILGTESGEVFLYCEKCAIMLASQGFSVKKIETQDFDGSRQDQIHSFLETLSEILSILNKNDQSLTHRLIDSQIHYNQQIQTVTEYFKNIEEHIQVQKYQLYNRILEKRKQAEEEMRLKKHEIEVNIGLLMEIGQDVYDNHQTVVEVEEEVYQEIMGKYENGLRQIQQNVEQPCNQLIPNINIELPSIIKEISQISSKSKIKEIDLTPKYTPYQTPNHNIENNSHVLNSFHLTKSDSKQKKGFTYPKQSQSQNQEILPLQSKHRRGPSYNSDLCCIVDQGEEQNDELQSFIMTTNQKFVSEVIKKESMEFTELKENARKDMLMSKQSISNYFPQSFGYTQAERQEMMAEIRQSNETLLIE